MSFVGICLLAYWSLFCAAHLRHWHQVTLPLRRRIEELAYPANQLDALRLGSVGKLFLREADHRAWVVATIATGDDELDRLFVVEAMYARRFLFASLGGMALVALLPLVHAIWTW